MTTISSQEFNRQASHARNLSDNAPVFITVHGKVSTVMLSIDDYHKLTSEKSSVLAAIGNHDAAFVEFELPARAVDANQRDVVFD